MYIMYVNYISVKLEEYKSQNVQIYTHTNKQTKEREKESVNHMVLEVDVVSDACVISLSLRFFSPKTET